MTPDPAGRAMLEAWKTNAATTAWLVERLPAELWRAAVPGAPLRTVRSIAAHLHNARSRWIRTLGAPHGVTVPRLVDSHRVSRRALLPALRRSAAGIGALLELGLEAGGTIPPTSSYVWRNLPLDVAHVLTYFSAHEAHHRGQIVILARQLGHRLPAEVAGGLWQWTRRVRERRRAARSR